MTMVVAELEKTLSSFPVVDTVVSLLDGVVEKLSALKRKVCCGIMLNTFSFTTFVVQSKMVSYLDRQLSLSKQKMRAPSYASGA